MSPVRLVCTDLAPSPCLANILSSSISSWATIVTTNAPKAHTNISIISQRSKTPPTTSDTGLRREQVGGIIIGICIGLLLLLTLCWLCFGRRRHQRSWSSDTDSEEFVPPQSAPPPPPPVPVLPTQRTSKLVHIAPPKQPQVRLDLPLAEKVYDDAALKSLASRKEYAKSNTDHAKPKTTASAKQPQTGLDPPLTGQAHDDATPESRTFRKGRLGYTESDTVKKTPTAWVKTSKKNLGLGPDEINIL
jgi:hypothetical protein